MFVWDFILADLMDQVLDWIYGHIVGFLGAFFNVMGEMGSELFELEFVQTIVTFFSYLAWALFGTGLVVAVFECAIEYQNGRGSIRDTALNVIKGFVATSLFTVVPVELYKLSLTLQSSLMNGITGHDQGIEELAVDLVMQLPETLTSSGWEIFGDFLVSNNPILSLFTIIMMGYAVIKVFFASLKRGGILLIQIAVGSLYMFSVPRGFDDGFWQWAKQIVALCLTSFLQVTILTAGLMVIRDNAIIGLGLMLSANEVPRIAGMFGLETSVKPNITGAMHTVSMGVNTVKTIATAIPK